MDMTPGARVVMEKPTESESEGDRMEDDGEGDGGGGGLLDELNMQVGDDEDKTGLLESSEGGESQPAVEGAQVGTRGMSVLSEVQPGLEKLRQDTIKRFREMVRWKPNADHQAPILQTYHTLGCTEMVHSTPITAHQTPEHHVPNSKARTKTGARTSTLPCC